MDCMQACEIISAAHDGEPVDAGLLAQARAHADACADCALFLRVLDRIASAPDPEAPPELVARIGEITGQMSRDARHADAPREAPAPSSLRTRRPFDWVPRIAILASAAAVLLVVVSAGGLALLSRMGQTAQEAAVTESAEDEALRAAPPAGVTEEADSPVAGAAAPPDYVSLDESVWMIEGAADTPTSTLVSAGLVRTSLGEGLTRSRNAFYPGDDRSALYVLGDGGYLVFRRVTRTLGGVEYGLVTETPLEAFGMWPSLPGRFAAPVTADGSPAFEPAGRDDRGAEVFVPLGGDTADGFAVAPDTAPGDPAAGNPGWTWWEPLP